MLEHLSLWKLPTQCSQALSDTSVCSGSVLGAREDPGKRTGTPGQSVKDLAESYMFVIQHWSKVQDTTFTKSMISIILVCFGRPNQHAVHAQWSTGTQRKQSGGATRHCLQRHHCHVNSSTRKSLLLFFSTSVASLSKCCGKIFIIFLRLHFLQADEGAGVQVCGDRPTFLAEQARPITFQHDAGMHL